MSKKVAIIGLGGHARGSWLKEVMHHPDFEMSAVVDTDTELLENMENIEGLEDVDFDDEHLHDLVDMED